MKKELLITFGITFLFLGIAVQPSLATVQPEQKIDIESKDYLFQTIIDIANNPDVKNLLEQYENDLFRVDVDRSVYRKILLRNPKLFFNTLFTKPSMSVEYIDKCYNRGIQITNIIGEDKSLEMIESIDIKDTEVIDKLNYIIKNDNELSDKITMLKETNKELKLDSPLKFHPILCAFLILIFIPLLILMLPFAILGVILGALIYNFPEIDNLIDKFPQIFIPIAIVSMIFLTYLIIFLGLANEVCSFY